MTSTQALDAGRGLVLPPVRSRWTQAVYELLGATGASVWVPAVPVAPADSAAMTGRCRLCDDDLQMALDRCYELHYADIGEVDSRQAWSPLVIMRAALEAEFELAIRAAVPVCDTIPVSIGASCSG